MLTFTFTVLSTPTDRAEALDDYLAQAVAKPLQQRYDALMDLADGADERGEREILTAAASRLYDRALVRQGIRLVQRA